MKLILTEQQVKDLVGNVKDIDFATDAPALMQGLKNIAGHGLSGAINTAKQLTPVVKSLGKNEFSPNIPKGNEMMHPLGHKEPISSGFGLRNIPVGSKNHKGVDIPTVSGSPVYAPLDGTVISSRDTTPNACGGFIQLSHSSVKTKFCHLRQMVVKQGDKVKKGQVIGYTGGGKSDPMRGVATGPHLHYEILGRGDVAMNPTDYQSNLV